MHETGSISREIDRSDIEIRLVGKPCQRIKYPLCQLLQVLAGFPILIHNRVEGGRLFPDDFILFVKKEELFIGLADIEYGYNIHNYNPVATAPVPLFFINCSLTFSWRYKPSGSRGPPARRRDSATSARTSVRKLFCNISWAATVSFACCALTSRLRSTSKASASVRLMASYDCRRSSTAAVPLCAH